MEDAPLVSICIPTFNRAGMVGKAIGSALLQSYPNTEVLVVDNASTDDTERVVSGFKDGRLRYVRNTENLGLFGNFNRCVELAHGKYVHILHSDDYIDPEFTRTCIGFLESNPRVAMTFSAAFVMTGETKKKVDSISKTRIFPAPEGFRELLSRRNFIVCPTVIIRREVYSGIGKYSMEYPYAADLDLWLRISKRYDIAYIDNAVLFYRQGEHSESFQQLFRNPSGYLDIIRIFTRLIRDLGEECDLYRKEINIALRRHMRDCLYAGVTRTGYPETYDPSIFFRYALMARALILPGSVLDRISKVTDLVLIYALRSVMSIPGLRTAIQKTIRKNTAFY